jgi:hypothetical protein
MKLAYLLMMSERLAELLDGPAGDPLPKQSDMARLCALARTALEDARDVEDVLGSPDLAAVVGWLGALVSKLDHVAERAGRFVLDLRGLGEGPDSDAEDADPVLAHGVEMEAVTLSEAVRACEMQSTPARVGIVELSGRLHGAAAFARLLVRVEDIERGLAQFHEALQVEARRIHDLRAGLAFTVPLALSAGPDTERSALEVACAALGGPGPEVRAVDVLLATERIQRDREQIGISGPPRQTFAPALPNELWSEYQARVGALGAEKAGGAA